MCWMNHSTMREPMRRTIVFSAGWTAFIVSWYVGCYFQGTTIPPSLTQGQQSKLLQFVPVIQNSADQNSQLTSWQSEEFLPRLKIELEEDDQIHVRSMPSKLNLSHGWSHNLDSERNDAWLATDQKVWKLMILFQHNLPMLEQAVASYRRASKHMARNIIIVDNSVKKEALHSNTLNSVVNHVIPTIRLLNFPELHNFMADIAIEQQLEFFFWAHADNYVLSASKGRDLGTDVIACMRQQVSKSPNWGMILFSYDHLAAFRTQTMAQVPWDPNIFQYGSECDVYGRIRDAGYDAKSCRVHLSYDMKRVLNITDTTPYLHVKRILDTDAEDKSGRNQWRENAMEVKETEWRKAMKLSSRAYMESKWKQRGCKVRGLPCHKPWPYCSKCPLQIPDCFKKRPSWQQLLHIYTETRKVFETNEEQPIAYENFVPPVAPVTN